MSNDIIYYDITKKKKKKKKNLQKIQFLIK